MNIQQLPKNATFRYGDTVRHKHTGLTGPIILVDLSQNSVRYTIRTGPDSTLTCPYDQFEAIPVPLVTGSRVRCKYDIHRVGTVLQHSDSGDRIRIKLHNSPGTYSYTNEADWELDPASPFQPGDKVRDKNCPQITGEVRLVQARNMSVKPDNFKVLMFVVKLADWEKIPATPEPPQKGQDGWGYEPQSVSAAESPTQPWVNTDSQYGWLPLAVRLPDMFPCEVTDGKEIAVANEGYTGDGAFAKGHPVAMGKQMVFDRAITHWRPIEKSGSSLPHGDIFGWIKLSNSLPSSYPCQVTNGKEVFTSPEPYRKSETTKAFLQAGAPFTPRGASDIDLTHWRPFPTVIVSTEVRLHQAIKVMRDLDENSQTFSGAVAKVAKFLDELRPLFPDAFK